MKNLTASALTLLTLLTLAATGCTGPRPLKGGKAFTGRTPAGGFSQVLLQGENPSVPSRQSQETIKTRTYTIPAGSRIEQSSLQAAGPGSNGSTLQRSNASTVFV